MWVSVFDFPHCTVKIIIAFIFLLDHCQLRNITVSSVKSPKPEFKMQTKCPRKKNEEK